MRGKKSCQLVGVAVMAVSVVYAAPVSQATTGVTYEVSNGGEPFTVKYTKTLPGRNFQPTPDALDRLSGTEDVSGSWSKTLPLGSADFVYLMAYYPAGGLFSRISCKITFNGKVIDEEDGVMAQCMGPAARAHMPSGM